ncbi:general secretion pathway protein GspE [Roseobacter cerasinus]|uniref:General secretion pathway protein GspE n=1 Tax=Roseobacter cerasinus TaxID=2602289 RepID=A0A640VVS5_9RHOB|nr:GspE/PulE family protein [Roseobacter cerasinus]GFE51957.1 general secretion pathway protein GspE [Roseobacter cerasinus]
MTPLVAMDDAALVASLISKDALTEADAERCLSASRETRLPIERSLLEFGLVEEEVLFRDIAGQIKVPFLTNIAPEVDLAMRLDLGREFLKSADLVPLRLKDGVLEVASANPRVQDALAALAFRHKAQVRMMLVPPAVLAAAIDGLDWPEVDQAATSASDMDVEKLNALANGGPVIRLVNDIISRAVGAGASDIHFEEGESAFAIRFRIDGVLRDGGTIPQASRAAAVSRLKIMGGLNISERRRPQDGRAQVSVRGRAIDLRISTLPSQFGESIVLRILDRSRVQLDWAQLGYDAGMVEQLRAIMRQPNGLFLVAGPTGSGKTTTLYAALTDIHDGSRKIVSVEDPIEYALKGVVQVPVDSAIDMTFARALRAILRQDPDVVMVGEIRDAETAEIAVRAALVGRMVLSTIHTNDAPSAVSRLIDLGVPPYLLSATLRGVLSQRLVAMTCVDCEGAGCQACADTGQAGRTVLAELLEMSPELASAISDARPLAELRRCAEAAGFVSMAQRAADPAFRQVAVAQHLSQIIGS